MKKVTQEFELPRNAGIRSVLDLIKTVLGTPRVEELTLRAGVATLTRWVPEEETELKPLDVISPKSLQPVFVIKRSAEIQELERPDSPAHVLCYMLHTADLEQMSPVAWCCGSLDTLKKWLSADNLRVNHGNLLGIQVFCDDELDSDQLYLCTTWGKDGDFQDTQKSYKYVFRRGG